MDISEKEYRAAEEHFDSVAEASGEYDVDPYLLLGIGSRESRWGLALDEDKTGDHAERSWTDTPLPPDGLGWGRGIMQIDYAAHEFARIGEWRNPHENIMYGAKVLRGCFRVMRGKSIQEPILTRAALASYNRGPGNILRDMKLGLDVDEKTAHGNYSRDVLARADWFRMRITEDMERPVVAENLHRMEPKPLAGVDDIGNMTRVA